jgi:hypothetical protein
MHEPSILTIDLRSEFFGFAVFETSGLLLDCGRKPCRSNGSVDTATIMRSKFISLLDRFAPSVVVLKHTSGRDDTPLLKNKNAIAAIKREIRQRSLTLVLLTRNDIYDVFRQSGKRNKHQIAAFISHVYPEIAWKMPPYRKNFHQEHHNTTILDSISLGLTYFAQFEDTVRKRQNCPPD